MPQQSQHHAPPPPPPPQEQQQQTQQKPPSPQQAASQHGQTQSDTPAQQQVSLQQVPQESSQHQHQRNNTSQAAGVSSPSSGNQSTEARKISCEDIQLVQNLIERCLQLYMNQGEVINTLLNQAKIEPGFTSLVWQKLEEQNQDFFKAYYTRLKLKKHIMTFNHLLEQQCQLMQKMRIIPTKPPMQSLHNGMHHSPMGQVPMGYPMPQLSNMPAPGMPSMAVLPHSPSRMSGGTPLSENFHSPQGSSGPNGMDPSLGMSSRSGDIALGSSSGNGATFPFGSIGNPADMLGLTTSMSLEVPFTSHDSHSHHDHHSQNGMVPLSIGGGDEDVNSSRESLGTLGHLPRNFSLSDLAAELDTNSDLGALGNYSSPFLSPETEAFLQSPGKDNMDDDKMLDPMDDLDFGDLK